MECKITGLKSFKLTQAEYNKHPLSTVQTSIISTQLATPQVLGDPLLRTAHRKDDKLKSMALRLIPRALFAATLLMATSFAQTPAQPRPCAPSVKSTPEKPCTEPPQSPRDQFPFPKEDSRNAPNPEALPPDAPIYKPDAPESPAPKASSPGSSHPFPTQPAPDLPAESSSSSSSSSSGSNGSADPSAQQDPNAPGLIDEGSEGVSTRRRKLPKVARVQSDDDRFVEDLTVAKFYRGRGNFSAAYQRVEDAVKTDPNDPEAHCELGELAQKLEKRDQAFSEYQICLKLDPDEKQKKTAQKGLAQLK